MRFLCLNKIMDPKFLSPVLQDLSLTFFVTQKIPLSYNELDKGKRIPVALFKNNGSSLKF